MPATVPTLAVNHWPNAKCAKAFWGQQELPPYRELLTDTIDWANPGAGEHWLDLGCGGGALSREIWTRTRGEVGSIVGLDCAAVNEKAYRKLQTELSAPADRLQFVCHDFSRGLALMPTGRFDHAVSGLSLSYAEHRDENANIWTPTAYDGVLRETFRVLKSGGRLVFSVNVPNPSWRRIAWGSMFGATSVARPLRYLKRAWRMMQYGSWLKREALIGRFHYLPAEAVEAKLRSVGFTAVEHRMSFRNQAFIFRAVKP